MKVRYWRLWFGWVLLALAGLRPVAAGTWTPVAQLAPGGVSLMMLLPDGTVMAKTSDGGGDGNGNTWYRLTPNGQGSYVSGTWSAALAPMADTRLYFASQILKDGRLFVAGGEYGTGKTAGETYNPLTNAWTSAPASGHTFSDANSEILPDGRVLVALVENSLRSTLIFDPVANTWTTGPTCIGRHNESVWVKLPDDSVLFVDRLTTNSERYIPAANTWVIDATLPVALYDPYGLECGPGMLLPNGKVIMFGSTGHTAIYTPSGSTANGSWVAGPDFPNGQGMPDAPCVMLPNGKVLCAVSPIPTTDTHFPSPTTFYEYDYITNSFALVATPTGGTVSHPCYYGTMLGLPDGTALYSDFGTRIYSYQGGGTPLAAAKPAVSAITRNGDGSYHLTGTQLNGTSEGSCYGDDNQNATNYPIVRLTAGSTVYYARTFNWSRTSVATGAAVVTTEFAVPAGVPAATYSLVVVANGIASSAVSFTHGLPILGIPSSSSVAVTTATLGGTVNPNGSTTTAYFEYGTTTGYGSNASVTLTPPNGTSVQTVSANLTGLQGGTTYHYRLTASNSGGTVSSVDRTFTTAFAPPTVMLGAASGITSSGATLNGTVNSNGAATTAQFEYGLNTSYGTTASVTLSPNNDRNAQAVSKALSGLPAGTTYRYRLTASSVGGPASTSDGTFTTLTPIENWRLTWFQAPSATGSAVDTVDPNSNGIPNLLEYALGGDPAGHTTGRDILPQVGTSAGNKLQIRFPRYLDRTDLTLTVYAADALAGPWTALAQSTGGGTFAVLVVGAAASESGDGNTRSVTVTDLYLTTDPAHPQRFMKLEASH